MSADDVLDIVDMTLQDFVAAFRWMIWREYGHNWKYRQVQA